MNTGGERVVGGTRRADGTLRPVRKIREGYVPPDEQQTYMSRGKQVSAPLLPFVMQQRLALHLESFGCTV